MTRGRVGLTGATGFVGRSVLARLLEGGYSVNVLARNPEKALGLKATGVEIFKGDVTLPASIDPEFFRDLDFLIHLVGIIRESGRQTFELVHFEGTRNIVDLAKEAGIKKYVHMSGLGTRPDARSRYHKTKWKAEEYVRSSGLTHTIFRPSVIFGKSGEFIDTLVKLISYSPIVPAIKSGKLQPVHVRDVAECFVRALDAEETNGRTIPIVGPEQLTLREIIERVCEVMGKRRLIVSVPPDFIYIPTLLLQSVLRNPPLTTEDLIMLEEDNTASLEEVRSVFPDYSPTPFKEGLREFLG
jgi:NADH dehydrogenase